MSLPNALRAYEDCRTLFEAAAADSKGARAKLISHDACINMRSRLHNFRALDRAANAETYPDPNDPLHGQSVYDEYVVQIFPDEDGEWWVYVSLRTSQLLAIEPLSDTPPLLELNANPTDTTAHEVHLIEDHSDG
jgi:hypothetical protein